MVFGHVDLDDGGNDAFFNVATRGSLRTEHEAATRTSIVDVLSRVHFGLGCDWHPSFPHCRSIWCLRRGSTITRTICCRGMFRVSRRVPTDASQDGLS